MMSAKKQKNNKKVQPKGKYTKTRIKDVIIDYYRNIKTQLDEGFEDESMKG